MPSWLRRRVPYVALALVTIALGLAVHWGGSALPAALRDKLGDALWAAMIAWWVGALVPGASLPARGAAALAICFAVEVSQLYQTPALDAARQTIPGQLILGSGFDPWDLVAYTLGVVGAALLERVSFLKSRTQAER